MVYSKKKENEKGGESMEEIVFPNQLRMLRRVRGKRMKEVGVITKPSYEELNDKYGI